MATASRHVRPRESLTPAAVAVLLGTLLHAVDQTLYTRAGPVPILLTTPVVATLVYLHYADATRRQTIALLAWGALGSAAAVLLVYLQVVGRELPRAMTGTEMVLYDLGMFLWFVFALAGAYAMAARNEDRTALVALAVAPLVQAAFPLLMDLLVATGIYG